MAIQLLKYAEFVSAFEVNSLALRADGNLLACGGFVEDRVVLHDLPYAQTRREFGLAYAGAPNDSVVWSCHDRIAAVADGATRVWIWDASTGDRLHEIDCAPIGQAASIAFDAAGTLLAIAGANLSAQPDADLIVFSLEDGTTRRLDTGIDASRVTWIGDRLVVVGSARTVDGPLALSTLVPGAQTMSSTTLGTGSDRNAFVCAMPEASEAFVMSWDNEAMCTRLRFVNVLEGTELLNERFSDAECKGLAYLKAAGRVIALLDDGGEAPLQVIDPLTGMAEGFPVPGSYVNGGLAVSGDGAFAVASAHKVAAFKLATV